MRRLILVASTIAAMLAAVAAGPLGAASSAPYVYGCTPAVLYNGGVDYVARVAIYNGSSSTANLTHKILAGTGAILSSGYPLTSTLPATHTKWFGYGAPGGAAPDEANPTTPFSIRVVSNVPLAVTLTHALASGDVVVPCAAMQP